MVIAWPTETLLRAIAPPPPNLEAARGVVGGLLVHITAEGKWRKQFSVTHYNSRPSRTRTEREGAKGEAGGTAVALRPLHRQKSYKSALVCVCVCESARVSLRWCLCVGAPC